MAGFKPSPETIAQLTKLNSTYRFTSRGAGMVRDQHGGWGADPKKPAVSVCEIIDLTTNEPYADAQAPTEPEALLLAVAKAHTAPKPLTAAQKADPNFVSQADRIAQLEAENAALKERMGKKQGGN